MDWCKAHRVPFDLALAATRNGSLATVGKEEGAPRIQIDETVANAWLATNPLPNMIDWATFQKRLTDAEYASIWNAAQAQIQAGTPALLRWINEGISVGEVNLNSVDALAAKAALVADNLLTQERADTVFI